jgi:hypothetical protein
MEAIIENPLFVTSDNQTNTNIMIEFTIIIDKIKRAKNEDSLTKLFSIKNYDYFAIGFGSSHLWVHQKIHNKVEKERILFVQF